MAETRPEPFAQRIALARGDKAPGPVAQHLITVPASAVPIFVFLHISKTAGTTMRGVFNEMFGPFFHLYMSAHDEKRGADGKRAFEQPDYFDNIMLLAGHFGRTSAVVRAISGRRIVFVSIMRDPVDRIVSHYDYVRRMSWHRLYDEVRDRTLMQAFADSTPFRNVCQNEQMRVMFGPRLDAGCEAMLNTDNYIIGALTDLAAISQVVSNLSGMPSSGEIPRFNRIEEIGGKTVVRARDQPDFADAVEAIRAANQIEGAFFARVKSRMIVTLPDWRAAYDPIAGQGHAPASPAQVGAQATTPA